MSGLVRIPQEDTFSSVCLSVCYINISNTWTGQHASIISCNIHYSAKSAANIYNTSDEITL